MMKMIVQYPWRGYWFGNCPTGHWWYGRELNALTRIIGLRTDSLCSEETEIGERPCWRCGKQLTFLTFPKKSQYGCPECTSTVPKDLLPIYLQMCPQCGEAADMWRPPPGIIGYVWKCESGHIFGGTYPTITPCKCWNEGISTSREKEDGTWVIRCGKCGGVLEKPDDSLKKRMRDDLELNIQRSGSGKVVTGLLRRIWGRLFCI